MRRREFILLVGGAAALPRVVRAQQIIQKRRIGVLMAYDESTAQAQAWVTAFREGFQKLGWREGGDFQIAIRWATGEGDDNAFCEGDRSVAARSYSFVKHTDHSRVARTDAHHPYCFRNRH